MGLRGLKEWLMERLTKESQVRTLKEKARSVQNKPERERQFQWLNSNRRDRVKAYGRWYLQPADFQQQAVQTSRRLNEQ